MARELGPLKEVKHLGAAKKVLFAGARKKPSEFLWDIRCWQANLWSLNDF